jgi:hypothetical protein
MNTNATTNDPTPAKSNDRPRIKSSVKPPAREAMPWYTCVTIIG